MAQMEMPSPFRAEHMMIVAGDYVVNTFEGTEQYAKPHRLVTHPLYNRSTNNADIMLIKVQQHVHSCMQYSTAYVKCYL